MGDYYILVDDEPRPVDDIQVWARWMGDEKSNRHIARTSLAPGIEISTVFLAIDYSFGEGAPVLFETMVFGGNFDEQACERYGTMNEARRGHMRIVQSVMDQLMRGD